MKAAQYEKPEIAAAMKAFAANPADRHAIETLAADPAHVGQIGTTCVATMISGGHAQNALPQRATANVNCRIFPGHKPADILAELSRVIGDPAVHLQDVTEGSVANDASPIRPDFVERGRSGDGTRLSRRAGLPEHGVRRERQHVVPVSRCAELRREPGVHEELGRFQPRAERADPGRQYRAGNHLLPVAARGAREVTLMVALTGVCFFMPSMPQRLIAISVATVLSCGALLAQRNPPPHADLQGTWNGGTMTPLERPAEFRDKATFTAEEADEYVRSTPERLKTRLPTDADRLMQIDLDDTYVERELMPFDRMRTSLVVDPPNGVLPPLVPAARARLAARPKRSFDDPEVLGLAERCLMGNFGMGGSLASPPMVPSQVIPGVYQIVQTDAYVLISTEWVHDARVVRMNSTHVSPAVRKWLGDSIGYWDGPTLVVDTTNFRPEVHNLNSGERLHVVERFTRVDAHTLRYRVAVDDPDTWATPWTAEWSFHATDAPMFPVECHEGNYAVENFLRGARAEEGRR